MKYYSAWAHGNSAKIETPENFDSITNFGWGTDVNFRTSNYIIGSGSNSPSWFHIPIPVNLPLGTFERTYLLSVEILFFAKNVEIIQQDIYDGSKLIHKDHQEMTGNQLFNKDDLIESIETSEWKKQFGSTKGNFYTISLERPHPVYCGIGISFFAHVKYLDGYYPPDEGFESRLIIASAGANFKVENLLERPNMHEKITAFLEP